jgi:hypothetical protein
MPGLAVKVATLGTHQLTPASWLQQATIFGHKTQVIEVRGNVWPSEPAFFGHKHRAVPKWLSEKSPYHAYLIEDTTGKSAMTISRFPSFALGVLGLLRQRAQRRSRILDSPH